MIIVIQYLLQSSTLFTFASIASTFSPPMQENPLLFSPPIGHSYVGALVVVGEGGAGVGAGVVTIGDIPGQASDGNAPRANVTSSNLNKTVILSLLLDKRVKMK